MADAEAVAELGALLGEPARARMLTALMAGSALTATELALAAGVAPSTASAHLAKLAAARFLATVRQGRHRYYRLADEDVADMLEGLMRVVADRPRPRPADPALRASRVCYDHLAGEAGVWMFECLKARGLLVGHDAPALSAAGEAFFASDDLDVARLRSGRRPVCRACLDWTERRFHLGGALGAAILQRLFDRRWARRAPGTRVVIFPPQGERLFRAHYGG